MIVLTHDSVAGRGSQANYGLAAFLRQWRDGAVKFLAFILMWGAALLYLPVDANAAGNYRFVDVTGRAVIVSEETEYEARLTALEDALYVAALQGGAKIDGFSIISMDTALDDQFVVRPASRILDYTITNEVIEDSHYMVSIRAAVGDLPENECQNRNHSNVTIYAPRRDISANAPGWTHQMADAALAQLVSEIDGEPTLRVRRAINVAFNPDRLKSQNDTFDYMALTAGTVRVAAGDYAIVPSITLDAERDGSLFRQESTLLVHLGLELFAGSSYTPVLGRTITIEIDLEKHTPWRTLNVLSRPKRNEIMRQMAAAVPSLVKAFSSKLACMPLDAKLQYAGKNLSVALGTHHGVGVGSLAFVAGVDTPWQILRVTEAGPTQATLKPLNNRRDIMRLDGKMIEFMELKR